MRDMWRIIIFQEVVLFTILRNNLRWYSLLRTNLGIIHFGSSVLPNTSMMKYCFLFALAVRSEQLIRQPFVCDPPPTSTILKEPKILPGFWSRNVSVEDCVMKFTHPEAVLPVVGGYHVLMAHAGSNQPLPKARVVISSQKINLRDCAVTFHTDSHLDPGRKEKDECMKNLWFSIESANSVVNLKPTEGHGKWRRYFLKYCLRKGDSAAASARTASSRTASTRIASLQEDPCTGISSWDDDETWGQFLCTSCGSSIDGCNCLPNEQ